MFSATIVTAGTVLKNAKTEKIYPAEHQITSKLEQIGSAPSSSWTEKQKIGRGARAACNQDYSPCQCSEFSNSEVPNNIYVTCYNVSVQAVQEVFQRVNDSEIAGFDFSAPAAVTVSLPADFLGSISVISSILIDCGVGIGPKLTNLVIDPLAFHLSQNSATFFRIGRCDLHLQTDMRFLEGFNSLEGLSFSGSNNLMAFQYLPSLTSLKRVEFFECLDLNRTVFPDLTPARLTSIAIRYCQLDDGTANNIVTSLVPSTSADSLEVIGLSSYFLTRIPNQVASAFRKLERLDLYSNLISFIGTSSLSFSSNVERVHLYDRINTIESGAFEGNSALKIITIIITH